MGESCKKRIQLCNTLQIIFSQFCETFTKIEGERNLIIKSGNYEKI